MTFPRSDAPAEEALAMAGVCKAFPGVKALEDVSFSVRAGEVHALIGENGAGKSTLLEILSGVYRADSGEIRLGGAPLIANSPKAARQAGIAMIHQELQLRGQGVAVIYVSHKLEEVFRVATRAKVLRDGKKVGAVDLKDISESQLVTMMVGRSQTAEARRSFVGGATVLRVEGLSRGEAVQGVNFFLRRGEVLGIAGRVGAGRTELVRLVAGVDAPMAGTIWVHGQAVTFRNPREAIARGVALLPEERERDGIIPLRSIVSNVSLPRLPLLTRFGLLRRRLLRERVDSLTQSVSLRPREIDRALKLYSGGNQRKAMLCRWLMAEAEILTFGEPTRGIDVGAKAQIYRLIENLAQQGRSIIVVSSELPEILWLADRVLVMRRGVAEGILSRDDLSEQSIMRLAITGARKQVQST